eukprot:251303_1
MMTACNKSTFHRSWFAKFGDIENIAFRTMMSSQSQNRNILVFLTFYDEHDATNAIQMMDGYYSKRYRTKLRVNQQFSVYCREFLTNGVTRYCFNYPRCTKVHRWIHSNEMIEPAATIPPHATKEEVESPKIVKHVSTTEQYDCITGCIEDIRQIRLQSDDTIVVKGIEDKELCNESVLRSNAWFGQFGSINRLFFFKLLVFVVYAEANNAKKAIASPLNGACIDGQVIHIGPARTSFCLSFLRNPYKKCAKKCGRMHKWISTKLADKIKHTRILQRYVVQVEGLTDDLCDQDVLISEEYFGQFGQIKRINILNHQAHITYYDVNNAMEAVKYNALKVRILTNTYCPRFLNKYDCNKTNCLYVHYWPKRDDIIEQKEYYNDDTNAFALWLRKTVQMEQYLPLFQEHQYDEISMIEFFDEDVLKEIGIVDDEHCNCILEHVDKFKASMDALKKWFESNSKFKSCQHLLMKNNIMTLDQLHEQIKTKQDAKRILTTLNNDDLALFVDAMQQRD